MSNKCIIRKQNVNRSETKNMLIRDFGLFCKTFQHFLTFICNTLQNCQLSGTETDSFCVLRKYFCGKLQIVCRVWTTRFSLLGCMGSTHSQYTVRVLMAPVPNGSISLIFLFQRFLISLFGTDKRWKKQKQTPTHMTFIQTHEILNRP